jgi:quinolinate synthase
MEDIMNDLQQQIKELKKKDNAIILAHYYQNKEIKDVADYVGDSLQLAKIAKDLEEEVVVVCGVYFMAESVKILSPTKKVLIPNQNAGCPMADMITVEALMALKRKHKDAKVVCYVNSSAEIKAISDICCTSSNAVEIVKKVDSDRIIFIPDKNLGTYVSQQVPEKEIFLCDGYCPVHNDAVMRDDLTYEEAKILVHPECNETIRKRADYIGSTAGILAYAKHLESHNIIIGTEEGIISDLQKQNNAKKYSLISEPFICKDMKKITLNSILNVLKHQSNEIQIEETIRLKAYETIIKMFND